LYLKLYMQVLIIGSPFSGSWRGSIACHAIQFPPSSMGSYNDWLCHCSNMAKGNMNTSCFPFNLEVLTGKFNLNG
jgi:hypothetical protein